MIEFNLCFFLLFLIIDLFFLIPQVTTKNFILTAELAKPRETPNNETNAKSEIQTLTGETKAIKISN